MKILLLSSILNYRTLAGASSKYKLHYLLPEANRTQMDIEFKELDRLSAIHRKNLQVYYLKRIYLLNAFFKSINLLKKDKVDLLWTTSPILGLICLVLKILYKKPYAIFVGQPFTEYIKNERPFYYRMFLPFYKIAMYISFRNADVITTHSKYLQQYVKKYGARNVVPTYYYGVDTQAFKPAEMQKHDKFTVMYAGRFSLQKGVDHLLDAFKMLKNKGFEFKAWMYGNGFLKEKIADTVKREKLDIEVCGYVNQQTLASKFNQADVFVVPSISEGLGFIAAEALSCGVPVVASRVGGLPDSIEGYGILVPPRDPKALAEAIIEIKSNYADYKRKALEGRTHITNKFDRKKVVKEFQDAMESVV